MKAHRPILVACAVAALTCCTTSPYYYDTYYGYYPVVYDDYYYDYAAYGGYYYSPAYYVYGHETKAASSVSVVPPAVRLMLARWNASVDPGCITATTTGDDDQDGIDASSTVTFQCSSRPSGGGTTQVTGTVAVRDLDDNAADAGYVLTFNGLSVRIVSPTGAVTERVTSGTETVQKVDGDIRSTRDVVVDATETYPDGVQRKSKLEMKSEGTLTPEIAPGSALVTRGTVRLSGQGIFTGSDGAAIMLTRQSDPTLHWNGDCAKVPKGQGFDAGAMVYRTSQGRQTRIVHESCDKVTVTNSDVPAQ